MAGSAAFEWGALGGRVDRNLVDRALALLTDVAPVEPRPRGLVHGDVSGDNLLGESDAGAVTAVLDRDLALFGDPDYEAASLLFWEEPCFVALHAALRKRHAGDPGWPRRRLCYQLRLGLEELHASASGHGLVDAEWLTTRLGELVSEAPRWFEEAVEAASREDDGSVK